MTELKYHVLIRNNKKVASFYGTEADAGKAFSDFCWQPNEYKEAPEATHIFIRKPLPNGETP